MLVDIAEEEMEFIDDPNDMLDEDLEDEIIGSDDEFDNAPVLGGNYRRAGRGARGRGGRSAPRDIVFSGNQHERRENPF